MKEIILPIWGALIASGFWAIAIFGAPPKEGFSLMSAVMIFVILACVGLGFLWAITIFTKWE